MVNLCVDKGNTRIKIGIFDDDVMIYNTRMLDSDIAQIEEIITRFCPSSGVLCNVGRYDATLISLMQRRLNAFVEFDALTSIPIVNSYRTPHTLGKDRLAAAIGATAIKPNSNVLIVDAGTAITYDFVDSKGVYHGGNIAPGLTMRLKALNHFTSNLPLVDLTETNELLGEDTRSAILLGALKGVEYEINGYFEALSFKYPELSLFLTGGDSNYFESKLKNPIFVQKNLVLTGLNRILQFNVKK